MLSIVSFAFSFATLVISIVAGRTLIDFTSYPTSSHPDHPVRFTINASQTIQLSSGTDAFIWRNGSKAKTAGLRFVKQETLEGSDRLGRFRGRSFAFQEVVFSVKEYTDDADGNTFAVFTQRFPDGIAVASSGQYDGVASSFLSIAVPNTTVASASSSRLAYAHFSGFMAGNYPQYGEFTTKGIRNVSTNDMFNLNLLAGGIKNSGVLCLFDDALTSSLTMSPLTEFVSASMHVDLAANEVHYGVMGNVSSIPAEFEMSWVLSSYSAPSPSSSLPTSTSGGVVNKGVLKWGEIVRRYHGRSKNEGRSRDGTLQYVGYSTDNGAYYYYWHGKNHKNYQALIPAIKAYADEIKVPYRYIELDSWWYYRADGSDTAGVPLSGVTNWTALPSVFPDGMPFVHNSTGWPIMAHNRYWATNNVYASNPTTPIGPTKYQGRTFEFEWGAAAGLPKSYAFWDYLFSINSNWGLATYLQDWFSLTTAAVPALTRNATFGRDWLRQMGTAARAHGLSIQYCMSFPRHVMMALELPAVTQARASNDYQPESILFDFNQWRIAEDALWLKAIGVAASKDSYWTMPTPQYTPHYDPVFNTTEQRNRLESVVSSMNNGPITISDRIGYTDRALLMRCCRDDGLMLRPATAATPLDRFFLREALGPAASGLPRGGQLHVTHSFVTAADDDEHSAPYFYLLSVSMPQPANVSQWDLFTTLEGASRSAPTYGFLAFEANKTSEFHLVTGHEGLQVAVSNELTFQYFTFVPVSQEQHRHGVWVVQGELDKWIGASSQRFTRVSYDYTNAETTVVVKGASKEKVSITFVKASASPVQATVTCVVSERLSATLRIGSDGVGKCA